MEKVEPKVAEKVLEKPAKNETEEIRVHSKGEVRESNLRPTTSLSGPVTSSTMPASTKKKQSTGSDRTSYQYNDWIAPREVTAPTYLSEPLSPNRLKSEGKNSIRKFNKESGGFAIGAPINQPTLEFTPKFPEPSDKKNTSLDRPKTAPAATGKVIHFVIATPVHGNI